MLLSIVPTADSILPPGPNGNQRAFALMYDFQAFNGLVTANIGTIAATRPVLDQIQTLPQLKYHLRQV